MTWFRPPRSLTSVDSTSTFSPCRAGVGAVHVVEVAGEQVGLLAALGPADLDDHVTTGVRVRGHQQLAQLLVDGGQCLDGGCHLGLPRRPLGALGVGEHLARRGEVGLQRQTATPGVDDGIELAVPGGHPAQLGGIGVHRRVGQPGFEVGVLVLHRRQAGEQARWVGHGASRLAVMRIVTILRCHHSTLL